MAFNSLIKALRSIENAQQRLLKLEHGSAQDPAEWINYHFI